VKRWRTGKFRVSTGNVVPILQWFRSYSDGGSAAVETDITQILCTEIYRHGKSVYSEKVYLSGRADGAGVDPSVQRLATGCTTEGWDFESFRVKNYFFSTSSKSIMVPT
jgi:hypothetical protein